MRLIDSLAITAPIKGNSDVTHALGINLPEYKETYCGRDATEWLTLETSTHAAFVLSAYSCVRCKKILTR